MEEALAKYDESLEALEKQKETLELVMKKMGAEWEESGAGIGWMGDLSVSGGDTTEPLATTAANAFITATTAAASAIATATAAVVSEANARTIPTAATATVVLPASGASNTSAGLTSIMHSVGCENDIVGPSHEYLQTLLNVNEELLAESLASTAASLTTACDVDTNSTNESTAAAAAALLDDTITRKLLIDDFNNQQALLLHTDTTAKDTTYSIAPQQQQSQAFLPISPPLPKDIAQQHQDTNSVTANAVLASVRQQALIITPPFTPSEEQ